MTLVRLLPLAVGLLLAPGALAQPFTMNWHTIDCGGAVSSGGGFSISSTIGQPDAGPSGGMTGGGSRFDGGFWAAAYSGPTCDCDWNHDGALNSQDFFDFITSFFSVPSNADFN